MLSILTFKFNLSDCTCYSVTAAIFSLFLMYFLEMVSRPNPSNNLILLVGEIFFNLLFIKGTYRECMLSSNCSLGYFIVTGINSGSYFLCGINTGFIVSSESDNLVEVFWFEILCWMPRGKNVLCLADDSKLTNFTFPTLG